MTDDPTPWEPPLAGDETGAVLGALDRLRWTFRWKTDELDADGLRHTIGRSTLTIGGLLKHLAVQEDYAFTVKYAGQKLGSPWDSNGWDGDNDWEINSAKDDSPEQLYAYWDDAVARSREALAEAIANGGLDQQAAATNDAGEHANLRRIVCDLIEEYGRHTGQADLLREAVDGRVGEDPPPGWKPKGV